MPPRKATPAKAPAPVTKALSNTDNRHLPTKEAAFFRQVLQQYETKQFSKGLKTADAILKTRPEHGETVAMKALFLTCTDKKAEGHELIKKGVRLDMGSHIVWHVYGLIHRADKNFEEAYKCYLQATRIEKDSLNLLTDLSVLTIHLRHYKAYVDTRLSILRVAPRLRRNWLALALAQHLAGQFFEADRTLKSYIDMLREVPEKEYEHSEVLMYRAQILEEAGEFEKCLDFLSEHSGEIVDRGAYSVLRAHLLLKLRRMEAAEWAWEVLLEGNPDSYEYIKAYIRAKGADVDAVNGEEKEAAVKILDAITLQYPKSLAIRRLALDVVSGEQFRSRVSKYIIDGLSKGIPSLFADLKSLYSEPEKRAMIGEVVEAYKVSLSTHLSFTGAEEAEAETPAAYLWTLYFLAQHHSSGNKPNEALELINQALEHTPSLPELCSMKARILKRAGDVQGALEAMREAKELDGQDRFLNSKCAKYELRADNVKAAEATVGLFTKKDATSPLDDLVDMQCLWFIQEEAESFVRQDKLGLALKRYQQVYSIFTEIEEDQYDFHSYCVRKSTLRAYVDMIRYCNSLRSHPRFVAAAKGAVEIYLRVYDNPASMPKPALTNGNNGTKHSEDEVSEKEFADKAVEKKEKTKEKKGSDKKEEEMTPAPIVDLDPYGEQLLATKTPLEDALKFIRPLHLAAGHLIETWILTFEVEFRRSKYVLALQALRTAHSLDPTSPLLHPLLVRFSVFTSSPAATSRSAPIKTTLTEVTSVLLGSLSPESFNTKMLQSNPHSAIHIIAAAKGAIAITPTAAGESTQLLLQVFYPETLSSLQTAKEAYRLIQTIDPTQGEKARTLANQLYPMATEFRIKG